MTQADAVPAPARTHGDSAVVDSLLHPLAVRIRQLLTRPDRTLHDRAILIDDEENIAQALRAGVTIRSVFYAGDERISDALRQQLSPDVTIHEVAWRTCKKLFENDKVSRIFAIAQAPAPKTLDSLLATQGDLVVLDDVSISGNIGAIIRTSLALGAGGLVLLNAQAMDIYDRRLIRASRGYVFALPVVTATTDALIQSCQQNALPIAVTLPHAGLRVDEIAAFPERLAIAFGSEKDGCSRDLVDAASLRVEIPINPAVESLNVSAAAAITLFCRANARALKSALIAH